MTLVRSLPMRLTISKALLLSGLSFAMNVVASNAYAAETQACQQENVAVSTPSERFIQEKNGTVIDKVTGLMWQQCTVGLNGENCESGEASKFTWAEALLYPSQEKSLATFAGHDDWRMPNIRELASIVEAQCVRPSVNATIFPNTPSGHVWSSSPYDFYPHYSWFLNFSDGIHTYSERIDKKVIRLVRDTKS